MRPLLCALVALGCAGGTRPTLRGEIRDLDSGGPVAGVTIVARRPGESHVVTTDRSGEYHFALPPGRWTLAFNHRNRYATHEVDVGASGTVELDVVMETMTPRDRTAAMNRGKWRGRPLYWMDDGFSEPPRPGAKEPVSSP